MPDLLSYFTALSTSIPTIYDFVVNSSVFPWVAVPVIVMVLAAAGREFLGYISGGEEH